MKYSLLILDSARLSVITTSKTSSIFGQRRYFYIMLNTIARPGTEQKKSSIDRFLEHCHRRRYASKSVIIYEGDQPDVLYYIVSGSVSVLMEDNEGKEIVLAYLNKGDFFGEMGLFGEKLNALFS